MEKNEKIAIGAAVFTCVFIVILISVVYRGDLAPAPLLPVPEISTSSSTPSSTKQQDIDTGLSLSPASSAGSGVKTPPPAVTYSGCELSLGFTGQGGNYALTAKNIGSLTCTGASISVYYADDETFLSASPNPTAAGYYWQLGNLAPGKEVDVALATTHAGGSGGDNDVTDEACLSALNGTDACSNAGSQAAASAPVAGSSPASASTPASYAPASGQEFGTWEWTSISDMSQAEMQQIVNEAAANHFNVIYVTVDEYLTIAALPDGAAKQQELGNYNAMVGKFLALAAQKGIRVDAEAGWRDWGESANQWEAYKIMAFVASYNQAHGVKFGGVQYDIEPYLLPQYNADESGVLTDYMSLIDGLVQQDKYNSLPLTIVVPHFYDANEQWTPQVTVDGITAYTFPHILRLLNELPGGDGRIIIMAYRNFATGTDSAIGLSQNEVQEADQTNVKIVIAQETGPVQPSYVTFYGLSRSALFAQLGAVNDAFAKDKSFAGTAIDYLDPFLNLP